MGVATYRIYHNEEKARLNGYQPGDQITLGYSGNVDTNDGDYRWTVYIRHNVPERPDRLQSPSFSVGDVVAIQGEAWTLTRGAGWAPVNLEDLTGVEP